MKNLIVGVGGVALAIGACYGAVKLVQSGHPWMAFIIGAGAGAAGVTLATRSLQPDGLFPFEEQPRTVGPDAMTVH